MDDQNGGRNKLAGLYRGRVESNNDPDKLGRVRVRIPQLFGVPDPNVSPDSGIYINSEDLPWAAPCTGFGTGYQHGGLIVPEIGDYVFVMFENGDRKFPVYMGGCYGNNFDDKPYGELEGQKNNHTYNGEGWDSPKTSYEVPEEVYKDNEPVGKILYKSPKGATIYINEADGEEELRIIDRLGQTITLRSPVNKIANSQNMAQRLGADALRGTALNPVDIGVDGKSQIIIRDAVGQTIDMIAGKDSESSITIASRGSFLRLSNKIVDIKADKINLIADDINIQGDTVLSGRLYTTKNIITEGNVKIEQDLKINGRTEVDQTMRVVGNTNLESKLVVQDNVAMNSNLHVSGKITSGGKIMAGGKNANHHRH